jgi:Mlc titration factor MtfA (ptsG expression regulator)
VPQNLLKQKNTYFRNLSAQGQQRFLSRVLTFMEEKNFVGREGMVVTDEIRVLISASAVQLTYGLENYEINNLHTINVFPKEFYSRLYETSFKGLATKGGVLSLSWDHFREGYADDTDKLNLGLHELAHALDVDWLQSTSYNGFSPNRFDDWKAAAQEEFSQMRSGAASFLRKYASRNLHEFFAVCIEHFFEAPAEFRRSLPVLYGQTAIMLNQDPENISQDYRLRDESFYFSAATPGSYAHPKSSAIPVQTDEIGKLETFIRQKGIYIAMVSTFVGLFIGVPLLFWFSSVILLDVGTLLLLIFLCGALGMLQWRFVKGLIDMHYHQFAMYAFSGFGLCLINFLLFLNISFTVSGRTEEYDVDYLQVDESLKVWGAEGSPFSKNLTYYLQDHFEKLPEEKKSIEIDFRTGVLGFDVIQSCRFK